jgi:Cu/Ag efflux protein CusF
MKIIGGIILALSLALAAFAAEDVVTAVHGTIKKVDAANKTIVLKAADGTEHTLHLLENTAVHGVSASEEAAKDSLHGLKADTEVVAHYTKRGTDDTAVEIDKVGKSGLKMTTGAIKDIDRDGKKLVVKADDGAESTFQLSDHAAKDAGKDIAEGMEKGKKVTVYYSEEAGKKIAHFFEKI